MTANSKNGIGKIIKRQRGMIPLTLQELARASGVSPSYLGRVERGQRFPSARVLRKIAKPLGFNESEMLASAGYLSPEASNQVERLGGGRLDPYVATVLSQEPVEVQRVVVAILTVLKSLAKGNDSNIGFTEYAHRKYPELDEDLIIMIEDIIKREVEGREAVYPQQCSGEHDLEVHTDA